MSSNGAVLLYNAGGHELLKRVTVEKAFNMIWRGVARILEADEGTFGGFERPKSLELVKYVVTKWRYEATGKVPFSRKGVFYRDNFICAYCGRKLTLSECTLDHVLPKWKGNHATWNNSVTSCLKDNNRKGGRSPEEAGMKLRYAPHTPSFRDAYNYVHGKATA